MTHDTPDHAGMTEYDWTAVPPEEDAAGPNEDGDQADGSNDVATTSGAPNQAGPAGAVPVERPPHLPVLDPAALHGVAGEVVRRIAPHTEADPAALLFTLLAYCGAMVGPGPARWAGGVRHGMRLWPLICGPTAMGKKGTSDAEIRRVVERVMCKLSADREFEGFDQSRMVGGLSTGEGLIALVQDPKDESDPTTEEPAPALDRRLVITESEFAAVLARGKREGNTLMPVLRQAWDGSVMQTLNAAKEGRRIASGAHIVIIGHITPGELKVRLSEVEVAGGTANRFLPVASYAHQLIPSGGELDDVALYGMAEILAPALRKAAAIRDMSYTPDADREWRALYLSTHEMQKAAEGTPLGPVIGRALPYLLRLSVTYAALDGSGVIGVDHIHAARAAWAYVEASARAIFDDAEERAEEREDLMEDAYAVVSSEEIRLPDQAGVPADVIRRKLRGGKVRADQRRAALDALVAEGRLLCWTLTRSDGKAGRPRFEYRTSPRG